MIITITLDIPNLYSSPNAAEKKEILSESFGVFNANATQPGENFYPLQITNVNVLNDSDSYPTNQCSYTVMSFPCYILVKFFSV